MADYKRVIARLSVMGLLLAGAVVLNTKPAAAASCIQECNQAESQCLATCDNNLSCEDNCKEALIGCIRHCI